MAMWRVHDVEAKPVEVDFSGVGLGVRWATAIVADGIELCRAFEHAEVEDNFVQLAFCEACFDPGCTPWGWVALRRLGEDVVWIPTAAASGTHRWGGDHDTQLEFLMNGQGPLFDDDCWEKLRAVNKDLPPRQEIPPIDSRELALHWQQLAPGAVLGEPTSEPVLARDRALAVTEGELSAELDAVSACVAEHYARPETMHPVPTHGAIRPIEFWLDLPEYPGWKAFGRWEDRICFLLDDDTALLRESDARQ